MQLHITDGGRLESGYKGSAGDCACRALAIAAELPYQQAYDLINAAAKLERMGKRCRGKSSAREGVRSTTMRRLMASLGWTWVPTMGIGTGCKVHLTDGELPMGRLIVRVSKHFTAVIDGVIHDAYDPQREIHSARFDDGSPLRPGEWVNPGNGMVCSIQRRCVYGYWHKPI